MPGKQVARQFLKGETLIVTADNYYSLEVEHAYRTNSQRKTFLDCPAQWKAGIDGEYTQKDKKAFLHGNYIDMALTEPDWRFIQFKKDNQQKIYGRYGRFKDFDDLDEAIAKIKSEPLMMEYLEGTGQTIIQLDDFYGYHFKCKLDIVNHDKLRIVDLKTSASIYGDNWIKHPDGKRKINVPFYEKWDYWTQAALYRQAMYIKTGVWYDFYLVVIEKKFPYNRAIFDMTNEPYLEHCVQGAIELFNVMQMAIDTKQKASTMTRCEQCDYCVDTKVLFEVETAYPTEY